MIQEIKLRVTLEYRPDDTLFKWSADVTNGFTNGRGGASSPIGAIRIALDALESGILRLDDDLKHRVLSWHPS